jgi:hypothetical protein
MALGDKVEGVGVAGVPDGGVVSVQGVAGGIGQPVIVSGADFTGRDDTDGQAPAATGRLIVAGREFVWNGATWDRVREPVSDNLSAAGLLGAGSSIFNGTNWDRLRGSAQLGLKHTPSRVAHSAAISATLTLAALGAGVFYYIYRIKIVRVSTAAVAGTAILSHTTTQLSGLGAVAGNVIAAGQTMVDLELDLASPIRSDTANTAVTITMPAAGVGVQCRVEVFWLGAIDQA